MSTDESCEYGNDNWKTDIISQVQERNKLQCYSYQDLINSHNRLFDQVTALKCENIQLTVQAEKLKLGNLNASKGIEGNDGCRLVSNEQLLALEQKLLAQQEELTEIHKKRGENVQLIIDLNSRLTEKDKVLASKEESLAAAFKMIASLNAEISMYQSNNKQLEALNQMVKDEHQALQLAFTHLEEKLRKSQDENMELVERLKRYKAKDAERLNEENENLVRKRHLQMQRELEDATKDMRGLTAESLLTKDCIGPVITTSNAIPTKPYIQFDSHEGEVNAVKWSPVDRLIATGGADRKVKLWDVSKGYAESKGLLVGSNAAVMSVDFDSTGTLIIGASNDLASRVWTVNDQRLRHTLTGHCGKVLAAKFLGEPSKVVTGSHDRTLRIWDLRSRACVETKFAGSSCNDLVIMDGTGSNIISGHFDKRIRIWDTRNDLVPKEIEVQGKVTSLDLSRDSKYLLSCVRDDTLRLFDLRTNQLLQTFSADGFKVGCDWARAVFSPESNYVSVGSSDGSIFIWNVNTGKVEAVLKNEHRSPVTAVSWHPFANTLASVDRAKHTIVWSDI